MLLITAGEPNVAAGVCNLEIVERCRCNADFCAGFYTAPKPTRGYGPKQRGVGLDPSEGQIILDLVEDPRKVVGMALKGGADLTPDANRDMDYALKQGRGAVWLNLTEEQYRKLK